MAINPSLDRKLFNPPDQPEGRRIVYLVGRESGELLFKEFDTREKANKYIHKRHDSVIHYVEYLITTPGEALFIKEGDFRPRTEAMLRKSKARLRRKKKARRKARQAEEAAKMQSTRSTRW